MAQIFALKVQHAHRMAERLDIDDFFRELDPDLLCQYACKHLWRKWFYLYSSYLNITMKY